MQTFLNDPQEGNVIVLINNTPALVLRENLHPERALSQTVTTNPSLLWVALLFTHHHQLEKFSILVMSKKQFWILHELVHDTAIF